MVCLLMLSIFSIILPSVSAANGEPVSVVIVSPYEILEPSTKNNANDKDGFPPQTSEADVEEAIIQGKIVVTSSISNPSAELLDNDADTVDDLTIDDDNPRDLDLLDDVDDDALAAGTYYVYWNLDKTGYNPVDTPHGDAYNGSNSASISVVDNYDEYIIKLSYTGASSPVYSPAFTVTMQKSASIKQNDLDWLQTAPEKIEAEVGEVFKVRTLYHQNSAQGLQHLISQVYYNGLAIRLINLDIYYYDNSNPGSITEGVPSGWTTQFINTMELTPTELTTTDNKDHWVMEYTFEVVDDLYSFIIPYTQTIKKGATWKVDTGYEGFQSQVPEGVNPANLTIEKYLSASYPDGVVSGPNPPEVGKKTVYELVIEISNIGGDEAINVVVNDTIPTKATWENTYTASQGTVNYFSTTKEFEWNVGTVGVDASATLSFQVSVTPTDADVDQQLLLNSGAYVTGTSEESEEPVEDGPTPPIETEPVYAPPEMNVYKSADKSTAIPGDTITYTIDYENIGYGDAYDVIVKDTIPTETTYASSNPTYDSVTGSTYTWNIGTVLTNGDGQIQITVNVNDDITNGIIITNYVTLDYEDINDNSMPQESDSVDITVYTPIMTVSKTSDVTTADPGDTITYTIEYENIGGATAYNVEIQDTVPADTTYVSSNPTYTSVTGTTYTWNVGTVTVNNGGSIELAVQVNAGTADQTDLTNYVTLDYDDANDNSYPQENDDETVTVTAPVMTITKIADVSTANPGDTIVYTITYENTGTGVATDVTVEDTIPSGTTYVSSTPTYDSVTGSTYTWEIGTVAANSYDEITLVVTVNVGITDETVLTNYVTLDYDDANGNPISPQESDSADVTVTAPEMTFSKTADKATANPGDTITYTLSYHNIGTGDADNVVVEDTIPAATTFVSSTPAYDGVSGDTYTWNIGYVAADASGNIIFSVIVDAFTPSGAILNNTATLDYTDVNDNPLSQLTDYAITTVTAPIMTITKTADITTADPGDTIIYTIDYENTGTGWAANVVVKDYLSSYVTLVGTNPMYTSYIGNVLTWDLGNVGPDTESSITVTVTVNAGTVDDTIITNYVTLDYTDVNNNQYPQEDDAVDVEVTAPIMSFSKSVDKATTYTGDTLTYTLTYENSGDGVATDVIIVDTIPAKTDYVSASPTPTSVVNQVLTWNLNTVPANSGPQDITIEVLVGNSVVDNDNLHNTATLDYDDANGNPYQQLSDFADSTVLLGSIYGTVFNDLDFDGIFDAGEPGIPGVTVTLSTGPQTQTDANGDYSFINLPPGDYYVNETNLDGWTSTTSDSVQVTLDMNEDEMVNFGDAQVGEIKGTVWNDADKDGIWDSNEVGIWGVTVSLYDASNNFVAETTTDYDGNYIFENLIPGDYTVIETNLPGWTSSTPDSVPEYVGSGESKTVNFGDYSDMPPSAPSYAVSVGVTGGENVDTNVDDVATLYFSVSNSGDVGAQLRFVTLTAVIKDNTIANFNSPYTGHYEVYLSDNTLKWSGDIDGTLTQEEHASFDHKGNTVYDMLTWTLPDDVFLEGRGEIKFNFNIRGVSTGGTKVQFFTKSTEDHHTSGVTLSQITDKKSIWLDNSTGLWYPAHNSYDPWDDDISNGHRWGQWSWDVSSTRRSFAKASVDVTVNP